MLLPISHPTSYSRRYRRKEEEDQCLHPSRRIFHLFCRRSHCRCCPRTVPGPLDAPKLHVAYGPGDAAVAVIKRMNRHKPQVSHGGLQHIIDSRFPVKPVEKSGHLPVNELVPVKIDGDLIGRLPATFEIIPKAIRFKV